MIYAKKESYAKMDEVLRQSSGGQPKRFFLTAERVPAYLLVSIVLIDIRS